MSDVNKAINDPTKDEEEKEARLRGTLEEIKLIAKGGMSHIFRARQPSLDRYIVVKKLREELLGNPELIERFRREAKALASVLHQNIAHVYDFVESGVESYILMEYIEGIDLSTVIEKVGNLPPEIAASILLGVAKGVGYIHAHNLIHRDIKPSNIRLTSRGEVKLMDFGIVMNTDNHGLTRPGTMVGSPSYLSPEQVLGDSITPKSDLFLMGICFYEMLTGSRPFKEEAGETVFQRIRETKFVPPRKMQSNIPVVLEKIIHKLLERSPDNRFTNVKALILELEKFLGPSRSSHGEDLILKYADEEALLKPTIAYTEVSEESDTVIKYVTWQSLTAVGILIIIAIGIGFQWGRHSGPAPSQNSLIAPNSVNKPYPKATNKP
jgi:serine/threonine protein kinase